MLQQIIDRRLAGKNKSIGNRERFLRRYQEQIARGGAGAPSTAAASATSSRARTSTSRKRDINEPSFGHGPGRRARDRASRATRNTCAATSIERPQGRRRAAAAAAARRAIPARARTISSSTSPRKSSCRSSSTTSRCRDMITHAARRDARVEEPPRRLLERTARRATCTCCARCAARSAGASRSAPARARELRELEARLAELPRGRRCRPGAAKISELEEQIAALRARLDAHPLPRPDRPALPQPRHACRCPTDQGGDVLPDGRLRLDGRGAQGPAKRFFILLYLFLTRALREDRPRLHPPPHAGAGSRRGELLPRPRDRRHRGLERARADGRDHPRALLAERLEHLRRAGERRRQLAPRLGPLPRAADRQASCRWCRYFAYVQVADGRAEPVGGVRAAAGGAARTSRCSKVDEAVADLSGVPRPVQERRSAA